MIPKMRTVFVAVWVLFAGAACTHLSPPTASVVESPATEIPAKINKTVTDGLYPNGPTCALLPTASWLTHTLYDLTYGCIPQGWANFFQQPTVRTTVYSISSALAVEAKAGKNISPAIEHTLRSLYLVSPHHIKAVILGQDPAPQPGVATGLAFSTQAGVSSSLVASIQRVLLEAQNEGICVDLDNGDLSPWVDNGVLLLNMALTIPCASADAFCDIGGHIALWGAFTQSLITYINDNANATAFILWGSKAGYFAQYVTHPRHTVLRGGHPSPRAAGNQFFCKNYFTCANQWLKAKGRKVIDWSLNSTCSAAPACIWQWNYGTRTSSCSDNCALASCNY